MSSVISSERAGSVLTLRITRAEKRNALSAEVVDGLLRALETAALDDDVRVVVLTGEGKAFSAGADLAALERMQEATPEENLSDSRRLVRLFATIATHPKPIIARVNGHAIAGGCGLAAVCDFSVAVEEAKLGFTEVRIGFVPAIVSVFVVRKIGEGAARELFLRGHLVSAQEAAEMGLINEAVQADQLDERVVALASELCRETSGEAIALTKRLLADLRGRDLGGALEHAANVNAVARETDDCRAGIRAFLEKSDPPWRIGHDRDAPHHEG